jgi:uncharacterized membrane protein
MIRIARVFLIASLALWVGGLSTISFVLAPTAFKVAPSRQVAGQIVGASLRTFGNVEIACGIIAIASAVFLRWKTGRSKVVVGLAIVMLAVTLSYVFWIYPEAAVTRMKLDHMPDDAVVKDHFALLHRISVILVSVNILVGTGALVCTAAKPPADGA